MDNSDRLIIAEFPVSVSQRQTDRQTNIEDIPVYYYDKKYPSYYKKRNQ